MKLANLESKITVAQALGRLPIYNDCLQHVIQARRGLEVHPPSAASYSCQSCSHALFGRLQSTGKAKSKAKGKGRKRKASGKGEEEFGEESSPEPMQAAAEHLLDPASNGECHRGSTPTQPLLPSDITSSNAYMLMYKKRGWQPQNAQPTPAPALPERCDAS